ncbi:MAG: imelysin family protein [Sulfitobacter sp.]
MRRINLTIAALVLPVLANAGPPDNVIDGIIDSHILPRFETLAAATQAFAKVASQDCDPASEPLRSAYGDAFDAWISVSHLRFGPTEVDDRAFALAFWPDSRGATPRALNTLIATHDPIAMSVPDYAQVSIAARGFYAMEFMLYDEAIKDAGDQDYRCSLIQTMGADIALTSQLIFEDWQSNFAKTMRKPAPDQVYRSEDEVLQEMFRALSAGLQFTAETRLGRPMGTFDRPRPNRSEARRSGRSAQHVMLSLTSLQDLATHLAGDNIELAETLNAGFEKAKSQLADVDDPTFASVAEPQARLKVEVIQQSVEAIRTIVRDELGPTLGVAAGFNSLDGD